jgi:3',5'-cyclic-AMP phosphodiesterase
MALRVCDPEVFGVTESSLTLSFRVEDAAGPVDAEARVRANGELRARAAGEGTRLVRLEGLEPATAYRIEIEVEGAAAPQPDAWFPEQVETLPREPDAPVATFATMNDLHFGEPRFGGTLLPSGDYGDEAPGFPAVREGDTEVPYWRFMNEDAIAEINESGVELAVIKGDIADRGLPEQFDVAARAFAGFAMRHEAFLGNHDYYGRLEGVEVDGYARLGQPRAPRTLDLAGWRLVLLETVEPGEHHGVLPAERLAWLADALEATREPRVPTLLLMHHQPVPPEFAGSFPNDIGIRPEHSLRLFDLVGRNPQVRGVLIGHTHRNRVRRYPAAGAVPFVEVSCTKDYPGAWGHYRLYEDGSFRQEVRRTGSPRALEHSTRCQGFFDGGYRRFALGPLAQRSFAVGGL